MLELKNKWWEKYKLMYICFADEDEDDKHMYMKYNLKKHKNFGIVGSVAAILFVCRILRWLVGGATCNNSMLLRCPEMPSLDQHTVKLCYIELPWDGQPPPTYCKTMSKWDGQPPPTYCKTMSKWDGQPLPTYCKCPAWANIMQHYVILRCPEMSHLHQYTLTLYHIEILWDG